MVNKDQWQVCTRFFDPSLCGEIQASPGAAEPFPLSERKIIACRATMEIEPSSVMNLGFGMPDGVAAIVAEEGLQDYTTLTIEQGLIGGIFQGGVIFGCSSNHEAVIDEPSKFNFYNGGGLDLNCQGAAEIDGEGNVNVFRFGGNLTGCGGFINISQNAKKVVFCGTFTTRGLRTETGNCRFKITQERKHKKFISRVEYITYSGAYARKSD